MRELRALVYRRQRIRGETVSGRQEHRAAEQDLTRLAERIIEQLDAADGDPDLEDNADSEEGGDGDPTVRCGDYYPGDPGDAEEGGDMELEPAELDLCDYEPSYNNPVSEAGLGRASWQPGPMPAQAAVYEPVPANADGGQSEKG